MEIISSKHVVDIVCRTLGRVDRRLTGHGERVAGLALQLLLTQKGEALSRREMDLVLAALFHDVGAYKTDEIDGLLSFEREGGWDHAVYGYLFLKNLSPLGEVADAVLYHHCPYRELRQIDTPHRTCWCRRGARRRSPPCWRGSGAISLTRCWWTSFCAPTASGSF